MDPTAPTTPATPEPAAPASFADAISQAMAAPTTSAEPATTPAAPTEQPSQSAPAPAPAADGTAPGTPATPAPAADTAWVKTLGGTYETPDQVRADLASLEGLRANQLTDDHRAVLRLSEDPAAWQEFNQLTHADYSKLDDSDVLFEQFKRERPGMDEEDVRFLFEKAQDTKYPGLQNEPDDRAHRADLAERKREAGAVREQLTADRQSRLDALKKGALGESPATQQAAATEQVQAHLDRVKQAVGSLTDGYKFSVDVNGQPLNLAVEAKDLPALQALMENPLAPLLNEAKTALDPQKLQEFAAWHLNKSQFLADAYKAGQNSKGPTVSAAELHNAEGTPIPASGQGGASLADLLAAAIPTATTKPRH